MSSKRERRSGLSEVVTTRQPFAPRRVARSSHTPRVPWREADRKLPASSTESSDCIWSLIHELVVPELECKKHPHAMAQLVRADWQAPGLRVGQKIISQVNNRPGVEDALGLYALFRERIHQERAP